MLYILYFQLLQNVYNRYNNCNFPIYNNNSCNGNFICLLWPTPIFPSNAVLCHPFAKEKWTNEKKTGNTELLVTKNFPFSS